MIGEYLKEFLSLRAIQRDLLVVLAREGPQHGLEIKRLLDKRMETELTIGRLYPNLDELAEAGLINKGQLTQRANCYRISEHGKQVLEILLGKILTLACKRSFRPHTAGRRPIRLKFHENSGEAG